LHRKSSDATDGESDDYSLFQPLINDLEQQRRDIRKNWLINRNYFDPLARSGKMRRSRGKDGGWDKPT
jgi:hypothetical protein